MKTARVWYLLFAAWFIIMACNLPSIMPGGATPEGTELQTQSTSTIIPISAGETQPVLAAASETSTVPPSATSCLPTITAGTPVNIRSGPGTVYAVTGGLTADQSAAVAGKSADGTWWYIEYSGSNHGWVSGSVVTATCIPASVAVIPAPPTPLPASGTCKDGYVWRLINSSDKVCISPASKAQVEADNAAADSRKIVNVYGQKACIEGYVWREAFDNDKVCVTPATRSQAEADNAAAASRWTAGAYGPHTCISGFVWREARAGDDVCVTPDVRAQAAADNAAADSRKAVNVYGQDACISGYVWRAAFSSDHVCVTPAVRDQTAADNAGAASHTWP